MLEETLTLVSLFWGLQPDKNEGNWPADTAGQLAHPLALNYSIHFHILLKKNIPNKHSCQFTVILNIIG